tara:strand:- start:586 stop:771 length:186 start_codon:yes stop_codon:yes gene_type:complete
MKIITIEETDIDVNGNEIVIDTEVLNVCDKCACAYPMATKKNTSYDGDCDDCGEFEQGVWQ